MHKKARKDPCAGISSQEVMLLSTGIAFLAIIEHYFLLLVYKKYKLLEFIETIGCNIIKSCTQCRSKQEDRIFNIIVVIQRCILITKRRYICVFFVQAQW